MFVVSRLNYVGGPFNFVQKERSPSWASERAGFLLGSELNDGIEAHPLYDVTQHVRQWGVLPAGVLFFLKKKKRSKVQFMEGDVTQ